MQPLCCLQTKDNHVKTGIYFIHLTEKNAKIYQIHNIKNGVEEPKQMKDFDEFLKDLKQIAYYCKIKQS